MNKGIIAAILSFLLYLSNFLGGGFGQPVQQPNPPIGQQSYYVLGQKGQIVADKTTVRLSPDTDSEPSGTVVKGQEVTILDKSDNWYKIRSTVGLEGWIPEYSVTINKIEPKNIDKVILGYYPAGDHAYESLLEHSTQLTSISPLGWQLDSYGALQPNFDPEEMGRSLYFAGNQELKTYAHLHLAANPSRLLNNNYLQQNSINSILDTVKDWGLKGILLDLGYLPEQEQPELFEFIEKLKLSLEQNELKLLLAFPWDSSIDYRTASEIASYIVLKGMIDETTLTPGPLASATQVENMLEEISQQVTLEKVILAVTSAGLDWSRTGMPTPLSHQQILELAAEHGANVKWDPQSKSPFFYYGNGHEVWFENRYSLKYKFELVKKHNLAGIALLYLGQEDPEIWNTLAKNL